MAKKNENHIAETRQSSDATKVRLHNRSNRENAAKAKVADYEGAE